MPRSHVAGLAALALLAPAACKLPDSPEVAAFKSGKADPSRPVPAQFAGPYYPPTGEALSERVSKLLNDASTPAPAGVLVLVVPHAGLRYSGEVAAEALATVRDRRFDRVVILGAWHSHPPAGAALPRARAMATPLGEVLIDSNAAALLEKQSGFSRDDAPFVGEQSVELVLPFVQKALGQVPVVPLIVGPVDVAGARQLAAGLRQIIDARTLVIVSSDFSRSGKRFGFTAFGEELRGKDLQARLREADEIVFNPLLQGDLEKFDQLVQPGQVVVKPGAGQEGVATAGSNICGRDALKVLLALLPPGARGVVRKYDNSFARDPDIETSEQVSYAAIAYPGSWPDVAPYSEADQAVLLKRAREVLASTVEGRAPPPPSGGSPRMLEKRGVFLTLFKGGEVRASVGQAESEEGLMQTVTALAAAAAKAPGVEPLRADELGSVKLELSVLGPLRPIKNPENLRLGVEGLFVGNPGHAGLLLPQVASELHLGIDEFLDHLAEQVGAPRKEWQLDALRSFTVQVVADPGAWDTASQK